MSAEEFIGGVAAGLVAIIAWGSGSGYSGGGGYEMTSALLLESIRSSRNGRPTLEISRQISRALAARKRLPRTDTQ